MDTEPRLVPILGPSPDDVSGTWGQICIIFVFPAWAPAVHIVGAWRDLGWALGGNLITWWGEPGSFLVFLWVERYQWEHRALRPCFS